MNQPQTIFTIPTYRLRDVPETIEAYDDNFHRNGHAAKIMVFDDSCLAGHQKYYALLEQTRTANELIYVGPREKEEFIGFLNRKLRDKKLESLVRNLFRPSYGGNRNFTLIYTLGHYLISADDDMRPDALIEESPESLARTRSAAASSLAPRSPASSTNPSTSSPRSRRRWAKRSARCPRITRRATASRTPRWTWRPTRPLISPARTRSLSSRERWRVNRS